MTEGMKSEGQMSEDIKSADTKRACGTRDGDLVDLAWEKLAPERAEKLRKHMAECSDCAGEFEAFKGTRESVSSVADVAPSEGFRSKLMDRIRAAKAGDFHPTGPVSRRYAQIVERDRAARSWFRPRWKLAVWATAAAATLSAVMLSQLFVTEVTPSPVGPTMADAATLRKRAIFARHVERRECERGVATEIIDGKLDLANVMGEGGMLDDTLGDQEIILAGVADIEQNESCLMAFRAEDWATFEARHKDAPEGPEAARFAAIASSRQKVTVRDGQIEIPEELMASHLKGSSVVILKLRDRAEIWSPKLLRTYISLPPFEIKLDGVTYAPRACDKRDREKA